MILVKTRSSRLFLVSLHLLGVSTHFPSTWRDTGILGVNTQSIVLEISDPLSVLNDEQRSQNQPFWLQDSVDQTCLGPMGVFSECGDASFWFVIPKRRRQSSRLNWFRFAEEELGYDRDSSPEGYALQPADSYSYLFLTAENISEPLMTHASQDIANKECLTRSRKDNTLILAPCVQERSWSWQFNENGILYFEKKKKNKNRGTPKGKRLLGKQKILECVGKNSTNAVVFPCNGRASSTSNHGTRAVQMVVVQQVRAVSSGSRASGMNDVIGDEIPAEQEVVDEKDMTAPIHYPPSYVDIAHIHASGAAVHAQLNAGSSRLASLSRPKEPATEARQDRLPLQFLVDTNPILLANTESSQSRPRTEKIKIEMKMPNAGTTLPKIQMNPYVASSKDNLWTDPKTGLIYHTDLCNYLGYNRKEAGRHTLTGVGQYMKTAFNIKVYGVAHYVSKRDVLADPAMVPFAGLTSDELRESDDFYAVLRHMISQPDSNGFDRTLFIKTNMQLGLDTMQNSLQADWKLLTSEAKDTLIGCSMKSRPASDRMLSIIESTDNPSKCSCAQIAPESYHADPSCCARGTELVFTWAKDGHLEIRLNGDLMDRFHRPDIAAGIFFEYLRLDDPMSHDFLDHVVDGFPSLLAPLSQVRGVSTPRLNKPSSNSKRTQASHRIAKLFGGIGDALSSQASNVAGLVHNGANELTNNAVNTMRSVGDAARNLGDEMDRRRDSIGKHLSGFASLVYSRGQKALVPSLPKSIGNMSNVMIPNEARLEDDDGNSRILRNLIRFLMQAPTSTEVDEIVPMIHITSNASQQYFAGMVHFYLLLLLIVSFPANLTTKTKLVVVRKPVQVLSTSVHV
mmetsp:Transcript_36823/g.89429  ORF Transcript_36823/g.89429 Transcript_36823/m.89429 type:complete len:851 (+) Transcript_36823:238-2790(+)|eukprot:CAMPEP_0113627392 /NCGR_PEP_ID=MMETSP0017_2-20120614/14184_1 /TAXON_ID=2856 /ORGANISM="Cylindrotheca closterium" /LENGTH=850 /DNA_ID=CAMNT_0000537641 /DNA_START=200 /DNA_END=2752 /DNA_ORIENTATION=+ /assembly_acc=CAM_ASM_000147